EGQPEIYLNLDFASKTGHIAEKDPICRKAWSVHSKLIAMSSMFDPSCQRLARAWLRRLVSILPSGLEPQHVLAVHAAGRIPVEADMRGGGVCVPPDALQRMVEE